MGWCGIFSLLCFLSFLHSLLPFVSPLCLPDQRDALLLFKNSFVLDSKASHYSCDEYAGVTSYPKTNSWNKGVDCCSWDGVTCDDVTDYVIGLDLTCSWLRGALYSNSSILLLRHLQSLNLSGNDFVGSHISPNLTAFAKMTHLNLSRSHFFDTVPSEISCLSKLVSLDLSENYDESYSFSSLRLKNSIFIMLIQNTTDLRKLLLDNLDMSMVSPISFANLSSSLTHLSISGCSLGGIFPDKVFRLPSLTTLHVNYNHNMSGILPKSNWTGPLVSLSLSDTSFSGKILDSIGNMKSLTVLDLSDCKFTGHIPSSLWNLKQLQVLYLAGNKLSGVVEFQNLTKLKNLRMLNVSQELNLTYNRLDYTFPMLEGLGLPYCNLTKFPYFLNSMKRLTVLDLRSNRISGEIPSSICHLSSLHYMYFSYNNLSGNIPSCFGNLKNLLHLDLRNNRLQGPLPRSLAKCTNLLKLRLDYNNFSDIFPSWLKAPRLYGLDLCSNKFHGRIYPTEIFLNTSLVVIDLSYNKFEGPIPLPSPVTLFYVITGNNFTGKVPSSLCHATKLKILNLAYNSLIGSLPQCLMNFSTDLSILNLQMNQFEGTIPQSFSQRNSLSTLDLSRNQFEGTLPRSLVRCKYLEFLDLSGNQIEDTFPRWLGTLPKLKVLMLKSNNFKDHLNIPRGAHLFPKLHILDLSHNNFSGPLPANLIMNLKAIVIGKNRQGKSLYMTRYLQPSAWYENGVSMTIKGQNIDLEKILTVFAAIDLSCNSFQGDIPRDFGHLHSLIGLNLSHNHLTGSIPLTLGKLTNLEWLDLSSNKISGGIPRNLGDLAFLGYLDLSNNQLIGRIPQDKQLSTFSSNSFDGNPGLCGTPLPKACPSDARPPPLSSSSTSYHKRHENWFDQKTVWIGYASGIVIGISIAYIAFETGRPIWLARGVRMLDRRLVEWMEKPKRKAIKFHGNEKF